MTFWSSEPPLPPTDSYAELAGQVYCDDWQEKRDPGASLEASGPSGERGDKWTK